MKVSICLLLGVAVFSTLFLESSTASTGDNGLLDGVLGGVGDLTGNLLDVVKKLLGTVTAAVDKATGLLTGLWNEIGTLVQNTTGATKDILTELQTKIGNLLDTLAEIPPAIASGTSESLAGASGLVATAKGTVIQIVDILAANPAVASLLKNSGAVLDQLPELLDSVTKSIDQVIKVEVSV